jgi:nuclear pore complex protein Nup93
LHLLYHSHYLLAHGNIDFPLVSRTLNNLDPAAAFAPLQPLHDTDIDGQLRHSHEPTIITAIEEGRRATVDNFYRTLDLDMRREWEKQKELVFEELGRHAPVASSSSGTSANGSLTRSLTRDTGFGDASMSSARPVQHGNSHLQMHPKMMRYGMTTHKLNDYRKQGIPFGIVNAYMTSGTSGSSATDAVSLVKSVCHLSPNLMCFILPCSVRRSLLMHGDYWHIWSKRETLLTASSNGRLFEKVFTAKHINHKIR